MNLIMATACSFMQTMLSEVAAIVALHEKFLWSAMDPAGLPRKSLLMAFDPVGVQARSSRARDRDAIALMSLLAAQPYEMYARPVASGTCA
jgi:hypothetical protein